MKQKRKWTNRNQAQMKVATLWEDSYLKVGGKKAGNKCRDEKLGFHSFTKEQQIEVGKMIGKRNYENGVGLIARTDEKKREDGIKGGTTSGNKHKGKFFKKWAEENPELAFEQNSKIGKKQGRINVESGHIKWLNDTYAKENAKYFDNTEKVCPNCNKTITGLGMYSRWHGDNCEELEKIKKQLEVISHLPKQFTSNDVVKICKELEFNRKYIKYGICKNPNYIKVLHVGTNQTNPSIFEKVKLK
jgi:hypothetical protein